MTSVVGGEVEENISMVEEEEQIYLVAEEAEVPISGKEAMVSIIVIMHKARSTIGHGRTNSDIIIMSLQVTKVRTGCPRGGD